MKDIKMDVISQTLGAATPISKIEPKRELAVLQNQEEQEIDAQVRGDFKSARENIKILIEEAMPLIPDMIEMIKQSDSPKMIQATSGYIKMIADLNKMVVDMNNKGAPQPTRIGDDNTQNNVTNNVNIFTGTMKELLAKMNEMEGTGK